MTIKPKGIVYLIGAGPGDPRLITLRGIECLQKAEVVIYDRLIDHSLLNYTPGAERYDVGKIPGSHRVQQEEINRLLVTKAQEGKIVARLKGGDPCVFGRGGEEALALVEAGLRFEIVPGISSAIAVPAYAGIPVTQRGMASSVVIITGHKAENSNHVLKEIIHHTHQSIDTLVFLMSVENLVLIVEHLNAEGYPADTPVAIIERGTTPAQRTTVARLDNLLERAAGVKSPAVIVVGEVVRLQDKLSWFESNQAHSLSDLRILNIRMAEENLSWQEDEFNQRLFGLGEQPVVFTIAIARPVENSEVFDCTIQQLTREKSIAFSPTSDFDWILFSESASVETFLGRLFELGYDARSLRRIKIAALGEGTNQTLRSYSIRADYVAKDNDHPETLASDALFAGEVDVVTFSSPAAIEGIAQFMCVMNYKDSLAKLLEACMVCCLDAITAEAARRKGIRVDLTTEGHSTDGLIEGILQRHKARR